jgi:hypothetical protein
MIVAAGVRRTYFDPVTVLAAPRKVKSIMLNAEC